MSLDGQLEFRRAEVFQQLSNLFNLAYTPGDPTNKDWELMVADPAKIPSFLAKFSSLLPDTRFVLAEILMASFDLSVEDELFSASDWDVYWSLLRADLELFSPILVYWADVEKTGGWSIGPALREKLEQNRIELPPWPWSE